MVPAEDCCHEMDLVRECEDFVRTAGCIYLPFQSRVARGGFVWLVVSSRILAPSSDARSVNSSPDESWTSVYDLTMTSCTQSLPSDGVRNLEKLLRLCKAQSLSA